MEYKIVVGSTVGTSTEWELHIQDKEVVAYALLGTSSFVHTEPGDRDRSLVWWAHFICTDEILVMGASIQSTCFCPGYAVQVGVPCSVCKGSPLQYPASGVEEEYYRQAPTPKPKACTCDLILIMQSGCQCGSLTPYKSTFGENND